MKLFFKILIKLIISLLILLSISHVQFIYKIYRVDEMSVEVGLPFQYYYEFFANGQRLYGFDLKMFIWDFLIIFCLIFFLGALLDKTNAKKK
jgi:hypothetical protein